MVHVSKYKYWCCIANFFPKSANTNARLDLKCKHKNIQSTNSSTMEVLTVPRR